MVCGGIWCVRDTTLALPACPRRVYCAGRGQLSDLISMSGNALWYAAVVCFLAALAYLIVLE